MKTNIKRIPAYKTTDGKLFPTREKALTEQFKLDLEAILKSASPPNQTHVDHRTLASGLTAKIDILTDTIHRYKRQMRCSTAASPRIVEN